MAAVVPFIPLIATGAGMAYDELVGKPERQSYTDKQSELMAKDADFKTKTWEEQKKITQAENLQKQNAYDFAEKAYKDQEVVRQAERTRQAAYIKSTQDMLNEPVQQYDQRNVDTTVGMVKQQLDKQIADQRPGVLEGLATRGVRSSGISASALAPLDVAYNQNLAGATSNATMAELLAARTAQNQRFNDRLNFNRSIVGMPISGSSSIPGAPNFSQYPALPDNSNNLRAQLEQYALPLYNSRVTAGNINSLIGGVGYAYEKGGFGSGGGGGNESINVNGTEGFDPIASLMARTGGSAAYNV